MQGSCRGVDMGFYKAYGYSGLGHSLGFGLSFCFKGFRYKGRLQI